MVNRNSRAYKIGRLVGRIGLVLAGYICGKRWGRRPIENFPKK